MMEAPTILSEKTDFKDRFTRIATVKVRLPDGKVATTGYAERDDSVAMVVLDKENNIWLTDEWRVAYGRKILQIPAGGVETGATEERRIEQVHNELREELELDARKIEKLSSSLLLANVKSGIHLYLARDLFASRKEHDELELIEVVKMPFAEACRLFLEEGRETTTYTVLGLLLAKERLGL